MDVVLNDMSTAADVKFIVEFYYDGLTPYNLNPTEWQPLSPAPSGSFYIAYIHTHTVPAHGSYSAPDFKLSVTRGNTPLPIIVHALLANVDPVNDNSASIGIAFPKTPTHYPVW